ncbi:MAG: restriction endonuclease [Dehalococcoides mccartyi]|uniref:restriction endonuclease n=1 Tax=Dehalococcoides mccartyi TaxID=61435 RepID=UPI0030F98534
MSGSRYAFSELPIAPIFIDAVYESGGSTKLDHEPISKLLPKTGNRGGFRVTKRADNKTLPAYIVLYSTFTELEWPDSFYPETGILKYYGDNRQAGTDLHSTHKNGNKYLRDIFKWLNDDVKREDIPPFFVFQYAGKSMDARFLGIAAPGNITISPDQELIALWRTKNGMRFQNYEAHFTILDTGSEAISREWLQALINNHDNNLSLAPNAWKSFIYKGRMGIKPLAAPKLQVSPDKRQQMPISNNDIALVNCVRKHYQDNPCGFEKCAAKLVQMMDSNFFSFELTRPWRDGGRDALGQYRIGQNTSKLYIDCALEAKCYSESSAVGIKQTSRLISRIKHRQFGILVTTSYLNSQAYREIVEDKHPILIITAKDIAAILHNHGLNEISALKHWLNGLEK